MLYNCLKFNFSRLPAFLRKRKPKIFGFKHAMEGEIRKILTFVKLEIASLGAP